MNPQERSQLESNLYDLIRLTNVTNNNIIDTFVQNGVFTSGQKDLILAPATNPEHHAYRFYRELLQGNTSNGMMNPFQLLIHSLNASNQEHVVKLLSGYQRDEDQRDVIMEMVTGSDDDPPELLQIKIRYLSSMTSNPLNGTLLYNVHVDLLNIMISMGFISNPDLHMIPYKACTYMTPNHYHNLILHIIKMNPSLLLEPWQNGTTILHHGLQNMSMKEHTIKLLVELGLDINGEDPAGNTPFQYAVQGGRDVHCLSKLIELGGDVRTRSKCGWTLLHTAVVFGRGSRLDVIEFLARVLHPDDFDLIDQFGLTAFDYGVRHGVGDIVRGIIYNARDCRINYKRCGSDHDGEDHHHFVKRVKMD